MKRVAKRAAKTVGTLGLVGFAAMNCQAAIAAESGWYTGLGVGYSKARIHDRRIQTELQAAGLTMNSIDADDADIGYKLFAGRKFNRNFAVEAGYFNLGQFGFLANTTPAGSLDGSVKFQGLNLDLVGIQPFTEKLSGFGRVGYTYTESKASFRGTGAVGVSNPNPKERNSDFKFGVGAQYDFTRSLGLRGEWERYRVHDAIGNKGDVDLFSVGLVYIFGGKPAARAALPPPQYVAPAPEAPPVMLVIVPVVLATQHYCSILDIQFEINQKTVQREAEEKIDTLVIFMKKYPDTTAVIEGHTDEVGTSADNMRLSQTRAESVVTYMANNGIDRDRLQAVGHGETRPIADNNTEIGKRLNRRINAIIACATDIEGIPAVPARIAMAMELEFDAQSATVNPKYREELRKVATFMKANPRVTATVEGHTGNLQATRALAMEISQRRAQNVVNYLVDNFGVPRSRLAAEGFGGTRRFAYNTSLEGRQENRRVNIIFDFPPN